MKNPFKKLNKKVKKFFKKLKKKSQKKEKKTKKVVDKDAKLMKELIDDLVAPVPLPDLNYKRQNELAGTDKK
jgi:hypothetical protein